MISFLNRKKIVIFFRFVSFFFLDTKINIRQLWKIKPVCWNNFKNPKYEYIKMYNFRSIEKYVKNNRSW